jgi:hypothetical protein
MEILKKRTPVKRTKTKSRVSGKRKTTYNSIYATEHDFIIIVGGGLIVMILVMLFMFGTV